MQRERYVFVYHSSDYSLVEKITASFEEHAPSLGMAFAEEPVWIEVPDSRDIDAPKESLRNGGNFEYCITSDLKDVDPKSIEIVVVLYQKREEKAKIKRCLNKLGLPS